MPLLFLLFCFAFSSAASAAEDSNKVSSWLKNGERLEFEISWGFITAGTASMEVKPLAENKTEFYVLAKNNGAFKRVYPVADTIYLP